MKPLISTGPGDDDYGYGWWVTVARKKGDIGSYRADGRGGQYVVVVPSLNVILATTGGGFELDEIGPLLLRAFAGSRPLPLNPTGTTRLEEALRTIAQPPTPTAVGPLPAKAREISGRTFVFEGPNPVGLQSVRLDFAGGAEATAYVRYGDVTVPRPLKVGLDGVYRMSAGEYYVLRLRYEGDRVVVGFQETTRTVGAQFEGRLRGR